MACFGNSNANCRISNFRKTCDVSSQHAYCTYRKLNPIYSSSIPLTSLRCEKANFVILKISEESKKHYLDRRLRAHFNMTIERAADSWGTVEQASLSTYPNENEDQRKNRRRRERQAWVKRRKTHRELTDSSAPTFSQRYTQDYLAEKAARRRRNRIKRQIALIRARAWSARYGLKDISTPPYTPPDSDDEEPDTIASSKSYTPVALALTCVGCRSLRRACSLTTAGNVAPCERCSTKNIPCVARTPQPRSARQIQNFGSQVGWFPLVITTMQSRRGQLLPVERHNLGQTWPANVFRKAAEKSIADTPEAHAIAARIAARLASFEPTPAASDEPCHSCAASNAVCSSFRPCFTCHLEGRACGPPINYVSDESEQAQPVRQTDKRPRPLDFDVEMAPDLQAAKRRMIAPGRQSSRQLGMESIDPALEVFQGLGNSNLGQDSIMVQLDTARRAHHSLQNSANPNQRALSEAQKKVNFLIRRMHENALMPGVKESMPGRNEYRGSELFGGMQDTFQNANPGIDNMGRAIMRSPTQPRQTIANTNAELTQAATQVTDPSVLPNLAEWTQADFDALAAYDWNNDTDNVMNDLLEQQPQIFDPFSISFSADQNLSGVTDDSLMDIDWSAVVDPLPAIPSEYGVALSANVGYNQGALIASKRSWVSEDFDPSRVRLEDRRVYLKESGQEVFHLERIQAHEMDPTYGHLFNCVWFGHAPYQATIETYTSIKHTVAFEVWTAANVTMARAAAASVAQFAGAIEDHIKTAKEARDAANRESMSRRVDSMGQAATTPEPPLAPAEAVAGLSILLDEIKRPFGRHNRGPPGNFLALNGAYHCDELRRPENVDICTRAPAGSCDHTDHLGSRWYVCEECHDDVNQEVWSVEDDTVTGTKSWLCVQCETNAQAARAEQIARDPNSDGPIRVGFCVCASKLKHSWLCRRHRLESIQAVQVRSALMQENMIRVRAARNLSGDCCVHCGKNVEGSEATSKAWTCYGCQESVLVSDVA